MTDDRRLSRACPVCETETDEQVCPEDGVTTLRRELLDDDDSVGVLGRVFSDRYRVDRVLGEGGFGRVYVATQLSMGREVALKTLHPELLGRGEHIKRFFREAKTASQLTSPHVVRIHDFGVDEATGTPYLAMELLQGRPLDDALHVFAPLPLARAARICGQIAQALSEAAEHGIVHRDLKPANIFLLKARGAGDFVKVMDFGIAKILRAGADEQPEALTATGMTLGTPRYMSPEQALGRDVDIRSDLYALGCILHEMLTRAHVFGDTDRISLLMKQATAPPPPLPDPLPSGEALPPELARLHQSLLAKSPEDRPASCEEVMREMLDLERRAPAPPTPPAQTPHPPAIAHDATMPSQAALHPRVRPSRRHRQRMP